MNGNTKNWLSGISVVILIVTAIATFMWRIDTKSASADIRQDEKFDILDCRVDGIEVKYAEVGKDVSYIKEDMAEQKQISKEILKEIRRGNGLPV